MNVKVYVIEYACACVCEYVYVYVCVRVCTCVHVMPNTESLPTKRVDLKGRWHFLRVWAWSQKI